MNWAALAACKDADPNLFFPNDRMVRGSYKAARDICAGCEVREECLAVAMETEKGLDKMVRHGMWGGLSPSERVDLAKGRVRRLLCGVCRSEFRSWNGKFRYCSDECRFRARQATRQRHRMNRAAS